MPKSKHKKNLTEGIPPPAKQGNLHPPGSNIKVVPACHTLWHPTTLAQYDFWPQPGGEEVKVVFTIPTEWAGDSGLAIKEVFICKQEAHELWKRLLTKGYKRA